jgi:hypothetical protein
MHTALKSVCTLVLTPTLLLGATPAPLWNATGHMITARIAETRLEPAVKAEVNRLIALLGDFDPAVSEFVPAATWMDLIKRGDPVRGGHPGQHGMTAFNNWHYYDQPWNPNGLPGVDPLPAENVVWAIGQAANTVGSPEATDFEKALMLRMLIHFVGDLHQPLHMTTRISLEHPQGDLGGNDFTITGADDGNLHSWWDGTAGLFDYQNPTRDWNGIAGFADSVMSAVPAPDSLLSAQGDRSLTAWIGSDAMDWARESYRYGVNDAYGGIEPGGTPSAEYTARAQEVVRHRLAMGGYRLAAILNAIVRGGMRDAG